MSSPLARALRREVNLGRAGGTLWRWWLAEMRAMLGDGALGRLLRTSPSVAVAVDGDGWRLFREARGGGAADEIGVLDRDTIAAHGEQAVRALTGMRRRGAAPIPAVLVLPADLVLQKTLRLPAATVDRLDAVLPFEIGRHTPFPADRLYYRYEPVAASRNGGGGAAAAAAQAAFAEVRIVAAPRDRVDALRREMAAAGLDAVAVVEPGSAPLHDAVRRSLLPAAARPTVWTTANRGLAAALLLAAAAAAAAPFAADRLHLAAAEREIAALRPAADAARTAQTRRAASEAQRRAILAAKAGQPGTLEILLALTRTIPDGAWLTSLSLSGREIVIEGLAPSAASLVRPLETAGPFTRVSYRAPITRDPQTGLEVFQFALTLAAEGGSAQ
ncbi:MAG TPA: PilN domain-containing protein [Stellaceae bacterium]